MLRLRPVSLFSAFFLLFSSVATAATSPPAITVETTTGTHPAGTTFVGFTSLTSNPLGPFSGQSVMFRGRGPEVLPGTDSFLVYRYKLVYEEPVTISSIRVAGAGWHGDDCCPELRGPAMIRLLDADRHVISSVATNLKNVFATFTVPGSSVAGQVFYLEEFTTSVVWRYRSTITVDATASCQADPIPAFNWKQYTPWGTNDYDNSYFLADVTGNTRLFATRGATPVLQSGTMELRLRSQTTMIAVPSELNNLDGVASLLAGVSGINATVGGSQGRHHLSVYNTSCRSQSCFPRPSNTPLLCDGTCATGHNMLKAKTLGAYACAVTTLAMAMSSAHVHAINEGGGAFNLDPLELNEFMSNTLYQTLGGLFDPEGNVGWEHTTNLVANNISKPSLRFDRVRSLDDSLCIDKTPVIVKVASQHGAHYVLVTGKQGTATDGSQYSIADPGYNNHTLLDYGNQYAKVGVVQDPIDVSQLVVRVGTNADVLIVDAIGRRTGFDAATGQILQEIPLSSYLRDQIADDVTGDTTTGLTHSIQILKPSNQVYRVVVTGIRTGFYTLEAEDYPADGAAPLTSELKRLAAQNQAVHYELQFGASHQGVPLVRLVGGFQTTLSDISVSLRSGLINNKGIANSLSQKIRAAEHSSGTARTNILNAFRNQVNAQAGKHVFGVAVQVLLQDADLLAHETP